jgi:hypothetical protein
MSRSARVALAVSFMSGLAMFSINAQTPTSAPASGLWHLLAQEDNETPVPEHRMDIKLWVSPGPFKAAWVNRVTSDEMPYAAASFDGKLLRLQFPAPAGQSQAEMGWLQMTWNGTRFDGGYVDAKFQPVPKGRPLKLVRSKEK